MTYNFDRVPDRRQAGVRNKWTWYPKDVLPLWLADMDFPTPKPILDALHKLLDHGVLGYELPSLALQETVAARMGDLYNWKVKPEAVVTVTGIVSGFNIAARAFSSPKNGYPDRRLEDVQCTGSILRFCDHSRSGAARTLYQSG